MPRRKVVAKRPVLPDSKYSDQFVTRCVNVLMKRGKKSLAERIMYSALDIVRERTGEDPLKVFRQAYREERKFSSPNSIAEFRLCNIV